MHHRIKQNTQQSTTRETCRFPLCDCVVADGAALHKVLPSPKVCDVADPPLQHLPRACVLGKANVVGVYERAQVLQEPAVPARLRRI